MQRKTRPPTRDPSHSAQTDVVFVDQVGDGSAHLRSLELILNDLVIPLTSNPRHDDLLSADPDGILYSLDNALEMPPGQYIVHVFDLLRDATAGRHIMASMSEVHFTGTEWHTSTEFELPTGEACVVQKTNGKVRADYSVDAVRGAATFQIQDCRLPRSDRKPISLSLQWPQEAIDIFCCRMNSFEPYHRAKTIAQAISDMSINCTCLRLIQREIEAIPGADISVSGISVEDVYEVLEDKLLEYDLKVYLPSLHEVHGLLQTFIPYAIDVGTEKVVEDIAEAFIQKIVRDRLP